MGAELRVLRRRIRSVESTKKITRAQELIAASRIIRAQQRAEAARPYTRALVSGLEAAAAKARLDNPLLEGVGEPQRSAVLVVTSDRGFAGAYSANVIRQTEALSGLLSEQGQQVVPYVVGQKGVTWFRFRGREMAGEYTGFTGLPNYPDARKIADDLLEAINTPTEDGGVDEIHIVSTHFVNMVTQEVRARRLFPIVVEDVPEPLHRAEAGAVRTSEGVTGTASESATEGSADEILPLYDFEPSPDDVLDALLPQYAGNLVFTALLDAAAAEHAARRRAMKSATDNANELQQMYTQQANQARQAEITQEISEIVGGAAARRRPRRPDHRPGRRGRVRGRPDAGDLQRARDRRRASRGGRRQPNVDVRGRAAHRRRPGEGDLDAADRRAGSRRTGARHRGVDLGAGRRRRQGPRLQRARQAVGHRRGEARSDRALEDPPQAAGIRPARGQHPDDGDRHQGHRPADAVHPGREDRPVRRGGRGQDGADPGDDHAGRP